MIGLKERQLFESFRSKEYRDTFVDEHIGAGLAYQIRALRERNGWTQQELADRTGKAQETISQLENPDYGSYTLKTLKTLASAFDLALMVNFVSFREFVDRLTHLTPETIAPPSYEDERQMSFVEVSGNSEWQPTYDTLPDVNDTLTRFAYLGTDLMAELLPSQEPYIKRIAALGLSIANTDVGPGQIFSIEEQENVFADVA